MTVFSAIVGMFFVWTASFVYRRFKWTIISEIPGPKSRSIFTGNSPELLLPDCGATERRWQEEYGQVVRYKGAFYEDRLWVADPKALHHILQVSGYNYKNLDGDRMFLSMLADRGLLYVEGDVHKRQRKVMGPAFGMAESRSFVPAFRTSMDNIINKWNEKISTGPSGKYAVVNIPFWLSKATLDSIGIAAFDYDFGSVNDHNNPLTRSYNNIFSAAYSAPSAMKMFWANIYNDIPLSLLYFLFEILPGAGLKKVRENRAETRKVAKKLYDQKKEELQCGGGGQDIMSLLIKSNTSENEKTRLRDDEIVSQMRSLMLAGQDTTSYAITWILYELAKRPEMQARVRAEIMNMKVQAQARGNDDILATDIDNMTYTNAVIKETLRFDPVVFGVFKQAVDDDILPIHTPITTTSGKVIKEIAIPKGTRFCISIQGYHLNKELWGPDAHEFNPDRWFSPRKPDVPMVGMYGNMLAFSTGVRSCIGWRFALIEIQTFLISLLSNFEFSIPEGAKKVRRDRAGMMVPMLEGESERGTQLPLKVSPVSG